MKILARILYLIVAMTLISVATRSDTVQNRQCNVPSKDSPSDLVQSSAPDQDDDNVISELIGDGGRWQFTWALLVFIFQIPTTMHMFTFVFQTTHKDFWCARPDHLKSINTDLWKNLTQPLGLCTILDIDYSRFDASNFEETMSNLSTSNLDFRKCTKFEYDDSKMGPTITSDYNLICDQVNMLSVVEMCFLAGAAVGSVTSGWISDKYGRKHILMIFVTMQVVIGTLISFTTSLHMYMVLRIIIGFASMTVTVVSFVLVVEYVSGRWRIIIGILNLLPVPLSYVITAGIAYVAREWRLMQILTSSPWVILLVMWYWLPESPRWLLSNGKIDKLKISLEQAARMNGQVLPSNFQKTLEVYSQREKAEISTKEPVLAVFNKEFRKTTILVIIVWYSMILLYFGLTLHLNNLGGDIYMNTVIGGLLEAFTICISIPIVLKIGMRPSVVSYMVIAGVACLGVNFVPEGNLWIIIMLAIIGKCLIGANNAMVSTYTAQQYPTMIRNFAVGVGNFAAGLALITIPYMWLLERVQVYLPMSIMGCAGIVAGIGLYLIKNNPQV